MQYKYHIKPIPLMETSLPFMTPAINKICTINSSIPLYPKIVIDYPRYTRDK